jgi:hypothetical protein
MNQTLSIHGTVSEPSSIEVQSTLFEGLMLTYMISLAGQLLVMAPLLCLGMGECHEDRVRIQWNAAGEQTRILTEHCRVQRG